MTIDYFISKEVFSKFPEFCRGVVIAENIRNDDLSSELIELLRQTEKMLGSKLSIENIAAHQNVVSWREAYRSIGIKPSEFRPSVEALARRVLRKDPLPSINPMVDLCNLVSIKYLVPIGAHAIDVVDQNISLRLATGNEVFEPFGSDAVENPAPNEIIFAEGDTVLTRRWTWRQAKHTLMLPQTSSAEVNVDGLPPVNYREVQQICAEIAALISNYCGGTIHYEILNAEHPRIKLKN